ncbi:uncharacterized protein [Hetaerina americana]|uniref:uncharacterized protein n=1 Tax=Hetaerina americana TaxID=62018 RepID=UPI003A7F2A76
MSIKQDIPSLLTAQRWTTKELLRALQQNGLGDSVQFFRKRNMDGDAFLGFSELRLITEANGELSLTTIRNITKFIDGIKTQPEKRTLLFNRTRKPQAPIKPEESLRAKLKPVPSSGQWQNHGRNAGIGTVPIQPAFGSTRDMTSATTAPGNKVHSGLALGSRCDNNPVTIPTVFGNGRGSSPSSTFKAGPSMPSVRPPGIQGKKPYPPIPLNKPNLKVPSSRKSVPASQEDRSMGMDILLQSALFKAARTRDERQQNGWSTSKLVDDATRQTPKPPVVSRSVHLKPVSCLPMPPPMATGQEDEHMKEIVSSIQMPSVASKVSEIHSDCCEELCENTHVEEVEEIYEELDMDALEDEQSEAALRLGEEMSSEKRISSDIYECITDERLSGEYYVEPLCSVNAPTKAEFESTQEQVEELPLAPCVPAKPQGAQPSFMSSFKLSQIFRSSENKQASEKQLSKENNSLKLAGKLEEDPVKLSISRSTSPNREKITVSSELRKSPSSSTTSLITPNKGNAGQSSALPDQRLPPNLRPLPPTPGISSFRSGPSSNTTTLPRKISSKTSITQQPWYHNVDRRRGEEIVCNREDGTFLIRPSTQNQNPYTLTIWFGKRVYNIAIRFRTDQKFALGSEKPNEQSFWSLDDMVAYYQTEQLVLFSGGERTGQTSLKSYP